MSDDELRTLARAVAARPGDVGARAAYARALARRGDARGEHRERVRLARDGDPAARARLEGWVPWSPARDLGPLHRRRGRARAPRTRPGAVLSARLREPGHLVGVGRGHVVIDHGGPLSILDLHDLAPCWRDDDPPAYTRVGIVGEALVTAFARELIARDLTTGEVLARAELADHVVDLAPLDDGRGLIVYGPTVALVELMPQGFGERAWERPVASLRYELASGGPYVALQSRAAGTELLLLASGAPVWPRPARAFDGVATPLLAAVDEDLLLVLDERTGAVAAFSPEVRRLRWRTADASDEDDEPASDPLLIVEDELILTTTWRAAEAELAALDRGTGERRWAVRGPILPGPLTADGVVYAQVTPGLLSCLELETGAERFALALGDDPRHTLVAPCHDGLVLLVGDTLHVYTEPSS